ncbi:DNA modification methylase [uncultured Olegusella sp.]|uniref:DNA modification methylase n=1 Tax=uncultured Olegusella sp. TaxID=1979846 RepID=UPI00261C0FBC|nr:DNA modification methylase [uncultured Olegusella sp.]
MTAVPCIVASDLTPEQIKAFRLADNRVAEAATWDEEQLAIELSELLEMGFDGLEQLGFEESDFYDGADDSEIAEVPIPEEPEPRVKAGELWALGEHRLLCGDATSSDDVKRLIDGELADVWLTDPPYNIDYEGKTDDKLTIQNDSFSSDDAFVAFLKDAFTCALSQTKLGAAFYIWHASTQAKNFLDAASAAGMTIRQVLIWAKDVFTLGRQDYQWKHEPCLYGWKDGAAHYFTSSRSEGTVYEDNTAADIEKMSKTELKEFIRGMLEREIPSTVIHEKKPMRSGLHPTMKPIRLMAYQIRNSSKPGWTILDTFGGSGSTLIACEQTNRRCLTMELDPHYCDVIIQRWEEFTGKQAVRID